MAVNFKCFNWNKKMIKICNQKPFIFLFIPANLIDDETCPSADPGKICFGRKNSSES